ncbi:MAG: hypothetical protein JNJ78_16020 [Anaerolineae bacterium]|nr:hypothetical protein [Anaerolineae bacterium]
MSKLAILTDAYHDWHNEVITPPTPYGVADPIRMLEAERHHALICWPRRADPRATIRTLRDSGATHLWLCESVGALSPLLEVGDWLVPEDYIDGTRGQHYTYFSEKAGGYVQQVPAFDLASRDSLIGALQQRPPGRVFRRGVYVCVSNTRLETPAEALFWERAGGHIVGRYLSPYLTLARELEMKVAVLAHVTRGGGLSASAPAFEVFAPVLSIAWQIMEGVA